MSKKHKAAAADVAVGDIPADIWFDILLKLPAEDVAKFRYLSKVHQNLIDSPNFRRTHTDLSAHLHHHAILSSDKNSSDDHRVDWRVSEDSNPLIPLIKPKKLCRLADSCMGILCYEIGHLELEYYLLLWNPLTGCSRRISLEGTRKRCSRVPTYVLGYDDVTDDWKVLKVDFRPKDGLRDFEIYSLKMDSWKEHHFEDKVEILNLHKQPVFVEDTNSMHWYSPYYYTYRIVAYNFSTQEFNKYIVPAKVRRTLEWIFSH